MNQATYDSDLLRRHVCVEARELATLDDGSPAPAGRRTGDLFYPCFFRDASEIRRVTDGARR